MIVWPFVCRFFEDFLMVVSRFVHDLFMICLVFWGCTSYKNVLLAAARSTFSLFSLFFIIFHFPCPWFRRTIKNALKNHQKIVQKIVQKAPTNHQKVIIFWWLFNPFFFAFYQKNVKKHGFSLLFLHCEKKPKVTHIFEGFFNDFSMIFQRLFYDF